MCARISTVNMSQLHSSIIWESQQKESWPLVAMRILAMRILAMRKSYRRQQQYSRSASNAFTFPKRYADLLPPAFRQARFVTAWRKPRKLGDILRYRLNAVSSSPLAHANGSADTARESVSSPVHDESEGSGDDFFQATRFYTPSDTGRSSSSDSNI